jgi:tetratricopeptide (TPR) repeat protein
MRKTVKLGALLLACMALATIGVGCAVTKPANRPSGSSSSSAAALPAELPTPAPDTSPSLQARAPVMHVPEQWSRLSREGRDALQLDQLDQAEQSFVAAQEISRSFRRSDVRRRVSLKNLERLGLRFAQTSRPRAAARVLQVVADETKLLSEADYPELSALMLTLGDIYASQGRPGRAQASYQRALHLRIGKEGPNAISLQEIYQRLGAIHLEKDEIDEAANYAEKSRALAERSEANHALAISAWVQLGNVRLRQERYDEAIASFEQALAAQIVLAPDGAEEALIRNELANTLLSAGRPNSALAQAGPALAILEENEITGSQLAATLDTQAQALARVGNTEEASATFERAQLEAEGISARQRIELLENYEDFLIRQNDMLGAREIRRRIKTLGGDEGPASTSAGPDLGSRENPQQSASAAASKPDSGPGEMPAEAGWDVEPAEVIPAPDE